LVEVAVNRYAGRRCVSYVGMFDALRSNTAIRISVTSHILYDASLLGCNTMSVDKWFLRP